MAIALSKSTHVTRMILKTNVTHPIYPCKTDAFEKSDTCLKAFLPYMIIYIIITVKILIWIYLRKHLMIDCKQNYNCSPTSRKWSLTPFLPFIFLKHIIKPTLSYFIFKFYLKYLLTFKHVNFDSSP